MNDFFSWTMLATYSGAVLATGLITQFIKNFNGISKLPTQLLSYLVAFIVLILATWFTDALTVESAVMCILNAVVVAFASNGAYEAVNTKRKE